MLQLAQKIIDGYRINRQEDVSFFLTANLNELCQGANQIRRHFFGNKVDLCAIINGRSGRCSENCKFCAQSGHHKTGIAEYDLLDTSVILEDCKKHEKEGVHRYSIVTAGRSLEGKNLDKLLSAYRRMKDECRIQLCASHGLLSEEAYVALKEAGVTMYHENIETSRRFFPNICTTHTYDDKVRCIGLAKKAGLEICSGGIIGMGETWEDRIDMAFSLWELKVDSIPINALMPIKGTPLENRKLLTEEEILRTVAVFRYINPTTHIRLAAGRAIMTNSGEKAFFAGANATITGNMLTTSGNNIKQDKDMLRKLGFDLA